MAKYGSLVGIGSMGHPLWPLANSTTWPGIIFCVYFTYSFIHRKRKGLNCAQGTFSNCHSNMLANTWIANCSPTHCWSTNPDSIWRLYFKSTTWFTCHSKGNKSLSYKQIYLMLILYKLFMKSTPAFYYYYYYK